MNNVFTNKRVLITGASGSIGSALVKHVLKSKCKVVRALSNDENGLYELSSHFNSFDKRKKFESVMEENNIRYLHGDVTDLQRCVNASENIDIVIHAAAIKHVPFCEFNPFEANKINVTGTQNMVLASMQNKVKIFLLISTDKVVNPSSCLGATKLLAEKITVNANTVRGSSKTKFACVRFGNVIGSRGSILPTLIDQINKKKKLTLTDKKMVRYFMTIDDAVDIINQSLKNMSGGEIFIPRRLKMFKIFDLLQILLKKFGLNDKSIKIIGKRYGEKIEENLFFDYEYENIKMLNNFFVVQQNHLNTRTQMNKIKEIIKKQPLMNREEISKFLNKIL